MADRVASRSRQRLSRLVAALAACFAAPGLYAQEQWFPIGPAPIQNAQTYDLADDTGGSRVDANGRATVIAVNPQNPQDVWLGNASGGVWHSSNAGTGMNWKPETDGAASLAIGAIALVNCSPVRCNEVYVGTGENSIRRHSYYGAGILKGTYNDDDVSPGYVFAPLGDTATRFARGNVNNILVDGRDIWITLSSGQTSSASQSTVTAPTPPDGFGVHYSPDGGLTWTRLDTSPDGAKPTDLVRLPSGVLLAGFMGRGIFRREPAGTEWCPLHPGLPLPEGCPPVPPGLPDPGPAAFDHVELAVAPSDSETIYAVLGKCTSVIRFPCVPAFYRTSDSGDTWQQASATSSESILTYSRYTHALTIHPSDPRTFIYGGLKLWRTVNAGDSFEQLGSPTIHPDHHDVAYANPADPHLLYGANDGGFYYSLGGGDTWFSGNYDLQTAQFYSVAADDVRESGVLGTDKVVGGAQDNGTNMFTGGRVWQHVLDGDGGDSIIESALRMFATAQLIAPYRSETGGALNQWDSIGLGLSGTSAYYPPFVQHPSTKDLFFGTDRVFRRANSGSEMWSAISPIFDSSTDVYPDIQTRNAIASIAVAPSNANRIYVGLYNGALWVSKAGGPCPNLETDGVTPVCWQEVGGPNVAGDGLPNTVVTSMAVDPTNPDRVYATFSGFNLAGGVHVFTNGSGGQGAWSAFNMGLPSIPANVIKIDPDKPSTLWLGTDRGVYKLTDAAVGWEDYGRPKRLPNVPVNDIAIDNFRGRVYAATFGRGMYVLTSQPVLYTYEGWMDSEIWDILIYGTGFKPSSGIASCTVDIIQQDGKICARGNVDAYGDTLIRIGDDGNLVTDRPFFWEGKPVIAACLNGNCVDGVDIDDCNRPTNRISSVRVTCGGQVAFASASPDCPQQDNPPTSILSTGSSPLNAVADGAFDVLVATASTSPANGGDRVLCGTRVAFEKEDTNLAVAGRIRDAINSAPSCVEAGVSASLPEAPDLSQAGGEDFPPTLPTVRTSAPGITAGQLILSLRAAPGETTGICFNLDALGLPALNQLAIMRTEFQTSLAGAEGGTVTMIERSPIGTCKMTIPTTPGQSAEQIAAALRNAFMTTGNPGLPECESRQNPHDTMLDGSGLVTVFPTSITVCSTDPGVGFLVGPDGVDLAGFPVDGAELPPDCNNNGVDDAADIAGGTSQDINGDAVPDECQVAAIPCTFLGTAQGGQVSVTLAGFTASCTVSVVTTFGDSPATVAANLATAINADACMSSQGITASASGGSIRMVGFLLRLIDSTVTDPGIQHNIPVIAIPTLTPAGVALMASLLLLAGLALRLRQRRNRPRIP